MLPPSKEGDSAKHINHGQAQMCAVETLLQERQHCEFKSKEFCKLLPGQLGNQWKIGESRNPRELHSKRAGLDGTPHTEICNKADAFRKENALPLSAACINFAFFNQIFLLANEVVPSVLSFFSLISQDGSFFSEFKINEEVPLATFFLWVVVWRALSWWVSFESWLSLLILH